MHLEFIGAFLLFCSLPTPGSAKGLKYIVNDQAAANEAVKLLPVEENLIPQPKREKEEEEHQTQKTTSVAKPDWGTAKSRIRLDLAKLSDEEIKLLNSKLVMIAEKVDQAKKSMLNRIEKRAKMAKYLDSKTDDTNYFRFYEHQKKIHQIDVLKRIIKIMVERRLKDGLKGLKQ